MASLKFHTDYIYKTRKGKTAGIDQTFRYNTTQLHRENSLSTQSFTNYLSNCLFSLAF
jgi:hypothetical protein